MAYSEDEKIELVNSICESIENGNSLRKASIEYGLPAKTFYEWIDSDEKKSKQYARACELRAEAIVDEILELADESNADAYLDDEGNTVVDGKVVQRSKLQVDTRKWLVGKLNPKKYGDKLDVDHTTQGEKINVISLGAGIKPDETTD